MTVPNDLLELERAMWRAMVAGPDEAVAFYDEVLAERVLMLFPGGMVIDDRQQVVDSMRSVAWDSYELRDARVFDLGESSAGSPIGAWPGAAPTTTKPCSTARTCGAVIRGRWRSTSRPRRSVRPSGGGAAARARRIPPRALFSLVRALAKILRRIFARGLRIDEERGGGYPLS